MMPEEQARKKVRSLSVAFNSAQSLPDTLMESETSSDEDDLSQRDLVSRSTKEHLPVFTFLDSSIWQQVL